MNNKNFKKIVKEYKTEHKVDIFKIENDKYCIYQFNSIHQKYKEFSKQQFINELINWMKLDLKELLLIKNDYKVNNSNKILKLENNINKLKEILKEIN